MKTNREMILERIQNYRIERTGRTWGEFCEAWDESAEEESIRCDGRGDHADSVTFYFDHKLRIAKQVCDRCGYTVILIPADS